jgi:putative transposase
VNKPSTRVSQEALDLYWSWLLDEAVVGRKPTISARCGMRMSEMTAALASPEEATLASWWLAFSHLDAGKRRIQLPLAGNPYVKNVNDVSKGILARKDRRGRWRFEVVERQEWHVPEPKDDQPRIGVDVGINVMVATSDGRLLGNDLKPKFNALYDKVKAHRANRQRQGLHLDSPRLTAMERRLTGLVKTMAGQCANTLVRAYPKHVFVIEDLNLRGCRGSKRFAFKALHHALIPKAPTIEVNCAFTSQPCPSCLYVSRANRDGVKFRCRACGRSSHADVVGGKNVLGRSEDKHILLDDHYTRVEAILRERYRARRRDSSSGAHTTALVPSSRGLTEGGP